MCTYNGARYVGEQLASIAAQTRQPDEVVVCDDRSSDETVRVVEQFALSAPFAVRLYVNEQNLGSTRNFERAVRFCAGDLVALCDQDDVWIDRKLERIESVFDNLPEVGLVFTDAEVVDEHLRSLGHTLWQGLGFDEKMQGRFWRDPFRVALTRNYVTGATMAFRSRFKPLIFPFREINVWDWKIIHDAWITLTIAAAARVYPLDEPLIKYRQHPTQQLGEPSSLRTKQPTSWRDRPSAKHQPAFVEEMRRLEAVSERLRERGTEFDCHDTTRWLQARVGHLSTRMSLPDKRTRRLPSVLKELATLRYHRHSRGLLSAAKDLLF